MGLFGLNSFCWGCSPEKWTHLFQPVPSSGEQQLKLAWGCGLCSSALQWLWFSWKPEGNPGYCIVNLLKIYVLVLRAGHCAPRARLVCVVRGWLLNQWLEWGDVVQYLDLCHGSFPFPWVLKESDCGRFSSTPFIHLMWDVNSPLAALMSALGSQVRCFSTVPINV